MNKKMLLAVLFVISYVQYSYGATVQEFATSMKSWNKTFIIPIFIAIFLGWAIITGFFKLGKMKKSSDEQSDAVLGWAMGLIWPFVVLLGAEGAVLAFSQFFGV